MTLSLPPIIRFLVRFVSLLMFLLGASMLAQGQTIRYVRTDGTGTGSSWANASGDLQSMITASVATDQVWVAAGTYKPTTGTDRTISFAMKNGVAIYGGFLGNEATLSARPAFNPVTGNPSGTTLTGEIGDPASTADNSYHVINNPPSLSLTNSALLDGFVITGGNANGDVGGNNGGGTNLNLGGGMLNNGRGNGTICSPLIRNCSFQGNSASSYGGAIYNNGFGYSNGTGGTSSPVLVNCLFQNNSANDSGGAIFNDGGFSGNSNPTLTNCLFQNNVATDQGGAIYNSGFSGSSDPVLTNCVFQSNQAVTGGAMADDGRGGRSNPTLTNCLFQRNSASNLGGAIFNDGISNGTTNPKLINCAFVSNSAAQGGAIFNDGYYGTSSPVLTNSSFQRNVASSGAGGAMYNKGNGGTSTPTLTNCVLFDNGDGNTVYNGAAVGPTATYSLFDNTVTGVNVTGPGNLTTTTSPFASTTSVALNACSPAINAGNNAAYTSANGPTIDQTGNPRLYQGGRIDMGAVEYQAAPTVITLTAPSSNTATVGVAFSQNFTTSGGTSPYSYSLVRGSLPTGLSLDNMGVLSGTPTQAGSFTLIVLGRDATGCSGEGAPYELTVSEAVVEPTGPFAITAVTTISCTPILPNRYSLSFTPRYSGLTGQPITFRVLNELLPTTEAAPYTLQLYTDNPRITLSAVQTSSPTEATYSYDWLEACRASESTNTAPRLVMAIPDQAATVGVGYSYVIPPGTFTDDQTPGSLRLSARGLPPGISLTGYTLWGVPSTTLGSPFSVTLTASDPGNLSVSISVGFVVAPAPAEQPQPTPPFAITGVSLLSCTPVANRININFSPRYAGLSGQPIAFRVENELVATNEPGPYSLTLYRDNPVITLKATQTGSVGEASFAYNWLAACATQGQDNTPPRVNSPVASQAATVGQAFNLNLANTFADQETPDQLSLVAGGLPAGLSLAGSTISGTASASGVSMVTITATDPGSLSVSTQFILTVNPATVVGPPSGPFSITGVTTVSYEVVSAGQRRVSFTPRYSGLDGSPVSFSVVNEMLPTTQPGPYTLRLYTDNPTITLKAIQSGTPGEASFSYDWLAACNAGARMGALAERVLSVRVLGNPVQNGQVLVEVGGAEGGPLQFNLTDMRGQVMGSYQVESAGSLERHTFEVGRYPASLLLLRASTPTQSRTVNVLKAD